MFVVCKNDVIVLVSVAVTKVSSVNVKNTVDTRSVVNKDSTSVIVSRKIPVTVVGIAIDLVREAVVSLSTVLSRMELQNGRATAVD